MKVRIGVALAGGDTLPVEGFGAVLDDLDRRYPGLRFRVVDEQGAIRRHVRFFLNRALVTSLEQAVTPDDELLIVGALSGG